ncbi:MAG: DinB family protein [Dehalococcoidia bacterium]|nr:DinB family protein [Dehalococcoidia bacterium]
MFWQAVKRLNEYHAGATEKVLRTAGALTAKQFTAVVVPGQPALRDTLGHSCHAQIIHLSWWDGSMSGEESRRREFPVGNYPDVGAVRAMWQGVWRGTQTYLETLQCDADLERVHTRTRRDGQVQQALLYRGRGVRLGSKLRSTLASQMRLK